MKLVLEIGNFWGWFVTIGMGLMLAESSFRNGRLGYRLGFYLCGGNLLISVLMYFSEGGMVGGGWAEAIVLFLASIVAYLAYLGVSDTFRRPKNVRFFRCQYVGYRAETDEVRTPHVEKLWVEFRKLDAQSKLGSADASK